MIPIAAIGRSVHGRPDLALGRVEDPDADDQEQKHPRTDAVARVEIGLRRPRQKRHHVMRHWGTCGLVPAGKVKGTAAERRRRSRLGPAGQNKNGPTSSGICGTVALVPSAKVTAPSLSGGGIEILWP